MTVSLRVLEAFEHRDRRAFSGEKAVCAFVEALKLSFQTHAVEGTVRFEYDTRLYFGRLS